MLTKVKSFINYLKEWFWSLPMWKRVILSSLAGALGGSSIIGFCNRYALFYHAYRREFRIPVEGVEYLDLAISLVSFAFILTSIVGTLLVYYSLSVLANFVTNNLLSIKDQRKKQTIKVIIMTVLLSALFICFLIISFFWNPSSLTQRAIISFALDQKTFLIISSILILVCIFTLIVMTFAKSDKSRKLLTLALITFGILFIAASLFNQKVYSSFLRSIQYGGDIPIELEYRKADNSESRIEGKLLIRTSKSVTISTINNTRNVEIPTDRISKITYIKKKIKNN